MLNEWPLLGFNALYYSFYFLVSCARLGWLLVTFSDLLRHLATMPRCHAIAANEQRTIRVLCALILLADLYWVLHKLFIYLLTYLLISLGTAL